MTDIAKPQKQWSYAVIGLWFITFLYFLLVNPVWKLTGYNAVISWDIFGYYLYLPATFIYHDIVHLNFIHALMDKYHPSSYLYAVYPLPGGNYYLSYTMGLSILYSPFFFLGHVIARLGHYPADGLSYPYQLAIYLSGAFYSLLGLLLIRKVLKHFFDEKIVAILLLLLVFGTNYFHYSLLENGMQHIYLFFLYSLVLWLTIKWHQRHLPKYIIALGFTLGSMALMRPTEIIAILIPVLWNVTSLQAAREKVKLFLQFYKQIIIGAFCLALMAVPQMLYWKMATGHFVFYSYGNIGFDFRHPHIMDGLFSIRKGWLVYTPVMVLALLGFIPFYRNYKQQFWPLLIYFIINVYIVYSWSVWWYGGSFGARAMVQSYAILLIPFGVCIAQANKRRLTAWLFAIFAAWCIFLNLFQDWQYRRSMFSSEGMTPYVYSLIFLKTKIDHRTLERYDNAENCGDVDQYKSTTLFAKTQWPENAVSEPKYDDTSALLLDSGFKSLIPFKIAMTRLPAPGKNTWLKVSVMARFKEFEWSYKNMGNISAILNKANGAILKKDEVKIQHLTGNNDNITEPNDLFGKPNVWGRVNLFMHIPANIMPTDTLTIMLSNPGWNPIYVDDLKVELLSEPYTQH